jgi:hypothetical protein
MQIKAIVAVLKHCLICNIIINPYPFMQHLALPWADIRTQALEKQLRRSELGDRPSESVADQTGMDFRRGMFAGPARQALDGG